jgi:hypothetical protein
MNKQLEKFKEMVPLSDHVFELKHEPESEAWCLWVLFDRSTGKIESVNVNRNMIANYKSHYAVGFEAAQWVVSNISNKKAKELKAKIQKLERIQQIPLYRQGVCECATCGTYE